MATLTLPTLIFVTILACSFANGLKISPQANIIPPLPAEYHYEPHSFSVVEETQRISFETEGTVYGLQELDQNVTFNCETNQVDFVLYVPNLDIQGSFGIDAGFELFSVIFEANGTGTFQILPTPVLNGYHLTVSGRLVEDTEAHLSIENYFSENLEEAEMWRAYNIMPGTDFELLKDGLVVHPDEPGYHDIMVMFIFGAHTVLREKLAVELQTMMNQILAGYSLEQFIATVVPGGTCM